MRYLLDSNACIYYLRSLLIRGFVERFAAAGAENLAVCSVVRAELTFGVLRGPDTATAAAKLKHFLD